MTEEARFSVPIESDFSQAEQAARALEQLREKIQGGTDRLKEMQSAYKRLTGDTKEVIAAKTQLNAKVEAERNAIAQAQVKLLAMGTSYERLSSKAKKAVDEQKKIGSVKSSVEGIGAAVSSAGGPVAALRDKFNRLKEVAGQGGALGLVAMGVAGLVAAVVALGAALLKAGGDLGSFIIRGANAARTAALLREGVTGSADDAYRLGQQVDALARKLPTPKAQLNEMAVSLRKAGLSGQILVDTLNAVGQASAAVGDDTGAKLRELVDRGKLTNRFQVTPQEMLGTGVAFDDIAKALATQMRIGVKDARQALFEGRVKLADGAAAMRKAVEDKFGGLNLRKMMDLEVAWGKLKESILGFTEEIDLEPFLRGLKLIASAFDTDTVTGQSMKEMVTLIGNTISKTFEKAAPFVKKFVQGMVIGLLTVVLSVLKLRKSWRETMGDKEIIKGATLLTVSLKLGEYAVIGLAVALDVLRLTLTTLAPVFRILAGSVALAGAAWTILKSTFGAAYDAIASVDWVATGKAIIDGLVDGIKGGASRLVDAVKGLANSVKDTFTSKLEIRSPSKVFSRYGENTAEGYAEGVESGTPRAARAIDGMAPVPNGARATAGARPGAAGSSPISVTIHAPGSTKEAVDAMADESFLRKLTKAVRDANAGGGLAPAI